MEDNLTLNEKLDRLKTLVNEIPETEQTKTVLSVITEILSDMMDNFEFLDSDLDDLFETVDSHSELLDAVFSDDEESDEASDEEEADTDTSDVSSDDEYFELKCPSCGERLFLIEDELNKPYECPYCGEMLDVSVEDDDSTSLD